MVVGGLLRGRGSGKEEGGRLEGGLIYSWALVCARLQMCRRPLFWNSYCALLTLLSIGIYYCRRGLNGRENGGAWC